jgi:energy-coupling factor transporter ATP-binding protein EcfA2
LDLTYPSGHPKAGKPLDKICLIGKNGTGKTTLLELLNLLLSRSDSNNTKLGDLESKLLIQLTDNKGNQFYITPGISRQKFLPGFETNFNGRMSYLSHGLYFLRNQLKSQDLFGKSNEHLMERKAFQEAFIDSKELPDSFLDFFHPERHSNRSCLIFSPVDSGKNEFQETGMVPNTYLSEALKHYKTPPFKFTISTANVKDFWMSVIYHVNNRRERREEFERRPENLDLSKRELIHAFDRSNPDILDKLSPLWDNILEETGFRFNVHGAKAPTQLNENLEAYIQKGNFAEPLEWRRLSSGIQMFLLRLGYLSTIFFNRNVEQCIALVDEPEHMIFADLQYKLMDLYLQISRNTQFIVATHSPIIAAQFEPCERVILDFEEKGFVYRRPATTPEGDDPNDILHADFGVKSLLGRKGIEKWERYLKLKQLMAIEGNTEHKLAMAKEFIQIANEYHFLSDEKGNQINGI